MPKSASAKPLWQACKMANPEVIHQLLAEGANPNATWHGYAPLHTLTQRDAHHETIPTDATLRCIELLLRNGADPSLPGGFPPVSVMLLAAFSGGAAIIEILKKANVKEDPHFPAAEGRKQKSNPNAPDSYGLQAIHYCAGSRLQAPGKAKLAAALLQNGADPNASVSAGNHEITPLYLAANAGNKEIFDILLAHGADPDKALTYAMWNTTGSDYAASAMAHGAVPDKATADGKPLLNHLIQWGRIQHALWLLARQASPNLTDKDGWTALHQAASRGNAKVLRALLAAGADRARKDKLGHTAADVAQITGRKHLLPLLRP